MVIPDIILICLGVYIASGVLGTLAARKANHSTEYLIGVLFAWTWPVTIPCMLLWWLSKGFRR